MPLPGLAGILVVTVCGFMFACRQPFRVADPVPAVGIANSVVDVGQLQAGEVRRVVFPITNLGSHRLVINEIDSDCRCRNRIRRTILIPPGGSEDVMVSITSGDTVGPIEASSSFACNDPTRPRFHLTVRARRQFSKRTASSEADAL